MADIGSLAYQRLTAAIDPYIRAAGRQLVIFAIAGLALLAAGVFALIAIAVALADALGAVAACLILALLLALAGVTVLAQARRPALRASAAVPPRPAAPPGGLAAVVAATAAREILGRRAGLRVLTPIIAALGAGLLVVRLQSRRRPPRRAEDGWPTD